MLSEVANVSVSCGHQAFSLQLVDLAGRQVQRVESEGAPVELNLASLQKGMYLLYAKYGKQAEVQKLIVRQWHVNELIGACLYKFF